MKVLTTKEILDRLPEIMDRRGITSAELARQTGVSKSTANRLAGKNNIWKETRAGSLGADVALAVSRWMNVMDNDAVINAVEDHKLEIIKVIDNDPRLDEPAKRFLGVLICAGYKFQSEGAIAAH